MHLDLLYQLPEILKVLRRQLFHIGKIDRVVLLAIGTDILVDIVSLGLQYSDAATVEPILASITANVESVKKNDINNN